MEKDLKKQFPDRDTQFSEQKGVSQEGTNIKREFPAPDTWFLGLKCVSRKRNATKTWRSEGYHII